MKSWSRPPVPRLAGTGQDVRLHDSATASERATGSGATGSVATLYVCGITPYDATHLGHASTFIAYDTLVRSWLDAGLDVSYVQNVTDVDDPLLERAAAIGVDWRVLGADQLDLFRHDMEFLGVIPPDHYVAVTEMLDDIRAAAERLLAEGIAYRVGDDLYFDSTTARRPWRLGQESGLGRGAMLALSAERGGDPERAGKRDPLDPVLWIAARAGEPSWPGGTLPAGRPGWHIECSVIVLEHLGAPVTVSGGGRDLLFPHHEFTAGHTAALTGRDHAMIHSHAGLVAYHREKMSKSLGNLVFVSHLRDTGVDARSIRLAVLAHHYRDDWEWTDNSLTTADARLERWRRWAAAPTGAESPDEIADPLIERLRVHLAADLDTPGALRAVDERIDSGLPPTATSLDAVLALLGVDLR